MKSCVRAALLAATVTMAVLVLLVALFVQSCTDLLAGPLPERPFATSRLLLTVSDLSGGWATTGTYQPVSEEGTEDRVAVGFEAQTAARWRVAYQEVHRFGGPRGAAWAYDRGFLPGQVGPTPREWQYQSLVADQSDFSCYDWEGTTTCGWLARYAEYIVVFRSWLIPDRMSLSDMERIVRLIDARMARNLGKPPPR